MDDMPQNSWAPIAMSSSSLPRAEPAASTKIWAGGAPVADSRSGS
jgi:hypothetical protein